VSKLRSDLSAESPKLAESEAAVSKLNEYHRLLASLRLKLSCHALWMLVACCRQSRLMSCHSLSLSAVVAVCWMAWCRSCAVICQLHLAACPARTSEGYVHLKIRHQTKACAKRKGDAGSTRVRSVTMSVHCTCTRENK
jgi:hypothetical protein